MNKDLARNFHAMIRRYNVSAMYSDVSAEYTIELDTGDFFLFECRYGHDDKNRPARYYCVSQNGQIIQESYCLASEKHPSEQTQRLIKLLEACHNKVLVQDAQVKHDEIQKQFNDQKVRK